MRVTFNKLSAADIEFAVNVIIEAYKMPLGAVFGR